MAIQYVNSASKTKQTNSQQAVVKVAGDSPSGKANDALARIEEVAAEKLMPKSPFKKKRKVTSIRLQEEVEEALKSNGVNISDLANEYLTNHALTKGWL